VGTLSESERREVRLPWHESARLLLESIPGVISATIEGPREAVSEVRVWYEPTWPVAQVMADVDECLVKEGARLADTRFYAVVAQPDRRAARRARPAGAPSTSADAATSPDGSLRLIGHKFDEVQPGVTGVQVWIEWHGRTFSGAAVGPADPPGSLRTPALATLRALHSCLQVLYEGRVQPGLVLESAMRITVESAPVVVVALTASENARPRFLTSAWPDDAGSDLPVIMATLHATSRTVTRWLSQAHQLEDGRAAAGAAPGSTRAVSAAERRFALVDFAVDHGPSGELDVGVQLAGFGEAVNRRRNGRDDEAAHLELGASATIEAVHDLLRLGGWSEPSGGELRHAGARRLKTGEQDIVVVLAEASMNGHRVPLAGATSADGGLERAAITATLQATNPLVADRRGTLMPGHAGR
jgi:hypothetical protein